MSTLTPTERTYIDAYRNVLHAVYDCTKYVSSSLAAQVDALEAAIGDEARIQYLRDRAY